MGKNTVKYRIGVFLFGVALIVLFNRCQKTSHTADQSLTDTEARLSMLILKAKSNAVDSSVIYLKEALGLIDQLKADSTAWKYLDKITSQAIPLKDAVLFNTANDKAMTLAVKTWDSLRMGHAHWNYGMWFLKKERYDSAYHHYNKAQYHFKSQEHSYYTGKMHYNKAFILCHNKYYTGAEVDIINAIKLFEPRKSHKQLYLCYNLLGVIYNELNDNQIALEAYTKGLAYLDDVEDPGLYRYHSQNNIGILFHKSGDYKKAISYFEMALEDPRVQKKDKALYSRLLDNRAYSRLKLKDTIGLHAEFNRALEIRDRLGSKLGVIMSKYHLAWYRAYAGDTIRAIQLANESYQLAKRIESSSDVLENLELLSVIDTVNASKYLKQQIVLMDKLNTRERHTRNKFIRIQYETEKHKQQSAELSVLNNRRLLLIGFLLFLLVVLFVYFQQRVRYKQLQLEATRQKAANESYLSLNKQMEKYQEGREEERLRISRMLHDGVLPDLHAIWVSWQHLKLIEGSDSLSIHRKNLVKLKTIQKNIREASHALRGSTPFVSMNFTDVIADLIKEREAAGDFDVVIDEVPQIDWSLCEHRIKMELYYFINEALHNCVKHANASTVTIKIRTQGQTIVISIADNGVGMLEKSEEGIGLQNMQYRIDKLNGKLIIESTPQEGTTLIITIPYII